MSEDTARDADVIVVGAGPGGSTAAFHLAQAGLDVLLLEKTSFPREKVCGDGLTPRASKQLVKMGIDTDPANGWIHNKGLRIIGGGVRLELPWPELSSYPDYGLVRPRADFDDVLARHAAKAGRAYTSRPMSPGRSSARGPTASWASPQRSAGRRVRPRSSSGPRSSSRPTATATRLSLALGLRKRDDRPMGVAVRTYYTSPRHDDDWVESWLELWDRSDEKSPKLLPGYGWIFGVGDGTSNVGLGVLNTSASFGKADYRAMLKTWMANTPQEWGYREENPGRPRSSERPCRWGSTGLPHYARGVLLVGDAGGMVNPFNGEGIPYAMESGELAADVVVQALARHGEASRAGSAQPTRRRCGTRRGRVLHVGPGLREADRQSQRHEARDPARTAAPDPHEVRTQAAGEPPRTPPTATSWTGSSTACRAWLRLRDPHQLICVARSIGLRLVALSARPVGFSGRSLRPVELPQVLSSSPRVIVIERGSRRRERQRLHPHRRPRCACGRVRGLLDHRSALDRPAPLQPGPARRVRVRHRAHPAGGRRRPVPGEVLPESR